MKSDIYRKIFNSLPNGKVEQVCIGLHWTAVVVQVEGRRSCGLSSTLNGSHVHGDVDVPGAGSLTAQTGLQLAEWIFSEKHLLSSIGTAAVNALILKSPSSWQQINAEEVIAQQGAGKSVALVGHFPFVPRLRSRVCELNVLELDPQPGDHPTEAADRIIPSAQVVAISGTTIANHTLTGLLELCDPNAFVLLLGPSTILSPVLFDHGVDLLCGSVVTDIDPVLNTIREGGNFRQVHRAGVDLVCVKKGEL